MPTYDPKQRRNKPSVTTTDTVPVDAILEATGEVPVVRVAPSERLTEEIPLPLTDDSDDTAVPAPDDTAVPAPDDTAVDAEPVHLEDLGHRGSDVPTAEPPDHRDRTLIIVGIVAAVAVGALVVRNRRHP